MRQFLSKSSWKKFKEKGNWRIEVIVVFPMKDNITYWNIHQGRYGVAYLKIRYQAWKKDMETLGEYYGIAWRIFPNEQR